MGGVVVGGVSGGGVAVCGGVTGAAGGVSLTKVCLSVGVTGGVCGFTGAVVDSVITIVYHTI